MFYQIGDELDVVFHQFRASIVAAFLKGLGMCLDFGRRQTAFRGGRQFRQGGSSPHD
jgi:hypothetical protein